MRAPVRSAKDHFSDCGNMSDFRPSQGWVKLASVQRPTLVERPVALDHAVLHIGQRVNGLNSHMTKAGQLTRLSQSGR